MRILRQFVADPAVFAVILQMNVYQAEAFERLAYLENQNQHLQGMIASLQEEIAKLRVLDKVRNRILASIPEVSNTNPVAALINFCRHVLNNAELEFRHEELPENQEKCHKVTVYIRDIIRDIRLGEAIDARKRRARELAAKLAIQFLNEHPEIVPKLYLQ